MERKIGLIAKFNNLRVRIHGVSTQTKHVTRSADLELPGIKCTVGNCDAILDKADGGMRNAV